MFVICTPTLADKVGELASNCGIENHELHEFNPLNSNRTAKLRIALEGEKYRAYEFIAAVECWKERLEVVNLLTELFDQPRFACLIDPSIENLQAVEIGPGTLIMRNSQIDRGCRIGSHCVIHENVTFAENVQIGDFVTVENGAVLGSQVVIENNVRIGAYSRIESRCQVPANTVLSEIVQHPRREQ